MPRWHVVSGIIAGVGNISTKNVSGEMTGSHAELQESYDEEFIFTVASLVFLYILLGTVHQLNLSGHPPPPQ